MAGSYPGSEDLQEAETKLRGLLEQGIRHVINLMEPDEFNREMRPFVPYKGQMKAIAKSMGFEVSFERIPIRDGWVPSHGDMVAILDSIDSHVEREMPVYLHCWGGRGRTGMVVACYLTRHGLCKASEAVDKIRELRKNTEDHDEPSPESRRQHEMVLSWMEGE
jgi:protein tyrosine phosphatase